PDRGAAVPLREADAGLTERALLGRDERAAAGEDRGRRAAIGAEAPSVGLHPLHVHAPRGEARVDAGAALRPVLTVEDAGDEPGGPVGRLELERDPDARVDRPLPLVR